METNAIDLLSEEYDSIISKLKKGDEELIFRRGESNTIMTIEVRNEYNNSKLSKEQNIVEKWMEGIKDIIRDTDFENKLDMEDTLSRIESYCDAVIIGVTS